MLKVEKSKQIKKVAKSQVHMMSPLSSFAKFISLAIYQSKMNAFARLINHDKHVRLQRDVLKRFLNTALKQRKELKKFVISFWLKKIVAFRLKDSQMLALFNRLVGYKSGLQRDCFLAIRAFALSKTTVET